MPFTLSLVFSGPCVYVPSVDGRQLRVLVVDAGQPAHGTGQREHVPVLLFDPATLRNPDDDPVRQEIRNCDNGRAALLLGRQDVRLEGTPDPEGLAPAGLSFDTTSSLPDGLETGRFSFGFMPLLDEALPGAGDVDRAALLDVPAPRSVAARVLVERGEVFTATVSGRSTGGDDGRTFVLWTFEADPTQAEGRLLGLDVGVEAGFLDELQLVLSGFDNASKRVLRFAPPGNGSRVRLEISNRDHDRVCDDRFRSLDGILARDDPDFAFNYRVATNPTVARANAPIPRVAGGDSEVSGTTCGGGTGNKKP